MEMYILDSFSCSEPGSFVFESSYLTLKITGKKHELNTIRMLMRKRFKTRFTNERLFVFGSYNDFLSFLDSSQGLIEKPFIKKLKSLLFLKTLELKLPHGGNISFSKPLIMGVINATDDSFYSQSRILDETILEKRVRSMLQEGVDIID
ncbi:MAG: dihydropteroate synthase, partial [Bacteroidota bacterium]